MSPYPNFYQWLIIGAWPLLVFISVVSGVWFEGLEQKPPAETGGNSGLTSVNRETIERIKRQL